MAKKGKRKKVKDEKQTYVPQVASNDRKKEKPVVCHDCGWEGQVNQIVFNGRADRSECPGCTGTNFTLRVGSDETPNYKPGTVDVIEDRMGAYCRACGWEGATAHLSINVVTAADECPACFSDAIDFVEGEFPAREFPEAAPWHGTEYKNLPRCHEGHPPLPLGDFVIHGGSCIHPKKTDCDIYIGLDSGMKYTDRSFPWTEGEEFLYAIPDMGVPKKPNNFINLVTWVGAQLWDGRSVHVGCIGGHGRTGMFLAALVAHMDVSKDAVTYVRKNYCHRAVESTSQINFLKKHFGVKSATGSKSGKKAAKAKKATGEVLTNSDGVPWFSDGPKLTRHAGHKSWGQVWKKMKDEKS